MSAASETASRKGSNKGTERQCKRPPCPAFDRPTASCRCDAVPSSCHALPQSAHPHFLRLNTDQAVDFSRLSKAPSLSFWDPWSFKSPEQLDSPSPTHCIWSNRSNCDQGYLRSWPSGITLRKGSWAMGQLPGIIQSWACGKANWKTGREHKRLNLST